MPESIFVNPIDVLAAFFFNLFSALSARTWLPKTRTDVSHDIVTSMPSLTLAPRGAPHNPSQQDNFVHICMRADEVDEVGVVDLVDDSSDK